jgi:transglutaminase-like putative cysteine protease
VLAYREGICYAKSHLAAALLRRRGIPSGICYQRLTLLDDDSQGYAVHALNTAYLESLQHWIRFDARGNKPGVDAQFSLDRERLAFRIRPEYDEVDYLVNHVEPHPVIIRTLVENDDAIVMYSKRLPAALDEER